MSTGFSPCSWAPSGAVFDAAPCASVFESGGSATGVSGGGPLAGWFITVAGCGGLATLALTTPDIPFVSAIVGASSAGPGIRNPPEESVPVWSTTIRRYGPIVTLVSGYTTADLTRTSL